MLYLAKQTWRLHEKTLCNQFKHVVFIVNIYPNELENHKWVYIFLKTCFIMLTSPKDVQNHFLDPLNSQFGDKTSQKQRKVLLYSFGKFEVYAGKVRKVLFTHWKRVLRIRIASHFTFPGQPDPNSYLYS